MTARILANLACLAVFTLAAMVATFAEEREQIGTVMGKPVFRDQIRAEGFALRSELHRLMAAPSMEKFRQLHRGEITPAKEELAFAVEYQTKSLQARLQGEYGDELRDRIHAISIELSSDKLSEAERKVLQSQKRGFEQALSPSADQIELIASMMLKNWKVQRLLYDKFGGGRILWQQFGIEAFDAMHSFLKQHEAARHFTITDPNLRAEFYEYWTNEKMHGAFLTDDKDRIRETFLEPQWFLETKSE